MFLRRCVEILEEDARLADHPARLDRLDFVHVAEVHDAAAGERHCLPVVAGPGASGGDGHVVCVARPEYFDDLGLISGAHDEIGGDVVETILEDRGIPEEVARGGFDRDLFFFEVEM